MTAVSQMIMKRYRVLKTSFELNDGFHPLQTELEIKPDFSRLITRESSSNFKVMLGVCISKDKHTEPIPFSAEVVIEGTFSFAKWEEDASVIVTNNATEILFPYLRTLLTNITCCGEVPAYVLPIMNVHLLFAAKSKNE